MMEFLLDYVSFFLKVATFIVLITLALIAIFAVRKNAGKMGEQEGELCVTKLNDVLHNLQLGIKQAILSSDEFKKLQKSEARIQKEELKKGGTSDKPQVFVLDFAGDIKASAAENLRHEINAILDIASSKDEIVIRLESSGGMVHSYGFAASQLARIRSKKIPLTICVDKVAASGGYMMACIGDKILAAPFAILGSIGVVAQLPNFNRLLKKHDVDFEMHTAGQYKRTLTIFGENTQESRTKFQQDLELIHTQFKAFVAEFRPKLNIEQVATGETWLGMQALENKLIDEISTSDAYLINRSKEANLLHVKYSKKKKLAERLGLSVSNMLEVSIYKIFTKFNNAKELV